MLRQLVSSPLPRMTQMSVDGNVPGDLTSQSVFLDSSVSFLLSHASCTISALEMDLKYVVDDSLKRRLLL